MKRIFNIVACVNLLLCSLLCSCANMMEEDHLNETSQTDSYLNLNIQLATRANIRSTDTDKEFRVDQLRIITFDDAGNKEVNEVFTPDGSGNIPNPIIKVGIGRAKSIYAIANENGKILSNSLSLTDALESVQTKAEVERMSDVIMSRTTYSSLNQGILMLSKTVVDAEERHTVQNPQLVLCSMQRITSKIILNARREPGIIVKIKEIKVYNLYGLEYLYSTAPDYEYPASSAIVSAKFPVATAKQEVQEAVEGTFHEFERYYLGTNYAADKSEYYRIEVQYEQQTGAGAPEQKSTIIPFPSIAERNMVYTLNLNFLKSEVDLALSVKEWVDDELEATVVPGTFLSLSESELTMYGPHESTIGFETDGSTLEVEGTTQSGEPIGKYFTNLPGNITIGNNVWGSRSGLIVFSPIESAMSATDGGKKQIGIYFKTGNIRKLVKVTHINKEAYTVDLNANGGLFSNGKDFITYQSFAIGSPCEILPYGVYMPTFDGRALVGWSLSKSALVPEFKSGETVSYEELERPKDKVTLYAVWGDETKVSVMFDPNNKVVLRGMPDAQTDLPNRSVTIPKSTPVTIDYNFVAWNTKPDGLGTKYIGGDQYPLGTATSVLYAIWTRKPVKVTLWNTEGTDTQLATYSSEYSPNFTITIPPLVRAGYKFKGWNTLRDGSGTYYDNNKSYAFPDANMDLYAVWDYAQYTVKFIDYAGKENRKSITNLAKGDRVDFSNNYYWGDVERWFQKYPAHYGPDQVADPVKYAVEVNRYFEYWWDDVAKKRYDKSTAHFDMPDRNVVLEAKYIEVGSFPLWLHVGGSRIEHRVIVRPPYVPAYTLDELGWTFTRYFSFGYWGRHHTLYYPKGREFLLELLSSWEYGLSYTLNIKYNNGTNRAIRYNSGVGHTTSTHISADEADRISNIEIIN